MMRPREFKKLAQVQTRSSERVSFLRPHSKQVAHQRLKPILVSALLPRRRPLTPPHPHTPFPFPAVEKCQGSPRKQKMGKGKGMVVEVVVGC